MGITLSACLLIFPWSTWLVCLTDTGKLAWESVARNAPTNLRP